MRQNAHRAGLVGDPTVDPEVNALGRRYGSERADRDAGRCRRGGDTSQRRNLAERRSEEKGRQPKKRYLERSNQDGYVHISVTHTPWVNISLAPFS